QLPLVTYVRTLDMNESPTFISPQIVELLGYPLESWVADPNFTNSITHEDDLADFLALKERSMSEDGLVGEDRLVAADGSIVWVLDHMTVIRDDDGEIVGRQGFLVDITDRKELEDQLVRAQRIEALGLLAGGVAHDFNNLLTAISGYTQLAVEQLGESNP